MREHRYRITMEHLATASEGQTQHAPLQFETGNHDDLFGIIDKIRSKNQFDADTSAALALGLKLFGEVMLKNRKHPLFEDIQSPLRDFIGKLKSLPAMEAQPESGDAGDSPAQ
ncbi:DUF3861 domain-containing protein [Herbaspirillum rhizosphaerae]|uniref:DUF3861 domain-containing protein n=1 Tax=Herbaspirillum rhizosphaerae TaxID=346179 RepID=UPI00067CAAA4|nr:DUF3861 domain-containing protein [Herbaspirillum rhizosphaerae]